MQAVTVATYRVNALQYSLFAFYYINMFNLITKFKSQIFRHKFITVVVVIIIAVGGYYGVSRFGGNTPQTSYLTATVEKGTLITSVAGSGQVSASNQLDIKPKVSGDFTNVSVVASQQVKKGDVIAQIDAATAYKAVRDAQANLQSAQLSFDKLTKPATKDAIEQAQNTVASAQTSLDKLKLSQPINYQNAQDTLQNAQTTLTKAYQDAFTSISNAFVNLPNIISNLNDILYSDQISTSETSVGKGQLNYSALYNSTYITDQPKILSYQTIAENDYKTARTAYNTATQDFSQASLFSDTNTIENLLAETLSAAKAISQAIKSESNYLNNWSDSRALRNMSIFTQVTTYKTNLSTYTSQGNSALSNLSSSQTNLQNDKDAITTAQDNLKTLVQNNPLDLAAAEANLKEKQSALASLLAGADPLDIKTQQLSMQQKRNALLDAEQQLADYTIKAPFDGIIAAVNVKVGDPASSGTALVTLITRQHVAAISLNEVDVTKIKVGQKVNLTFDAIDGLSITGEVAEINPIGTVSQGVVNYSVKIIFDTQDQRILSGMSVNTTIITNVKTDVLTVANSAVKTDNNGNNYVQILNSNGQPQNQTVTIGLVNDTLTEIVSGLNEGDKVITQTINSKSTTSATSNQRSTGGGFGGVRIPGL